MRPQAYGSNNTSLHGRGKMMNMIQQKIEVGGWNDFNFRDINESLADIDWTDGFFFFKDKDIDTKTAIFHETKIKRNNLIPIKKKRYGGKGKTPKDRKQ